MRRTERSSSTTRAPMPSATIAALVPTTPPPMIRTLPGATPGTPGSSTPEPPWASSSECAPAWIDIRPATALIGASSGRPPRASVTVS